MNLIHVNIYKVICNCIFDKSTLITIASILCYEHRNKLRSNCKHNIEMLPRF